MFNGLMYISFIQRQREVKSGSLRREGGFSKHFFHVDWLCIVTLYETISKQYSVYIYMHT